jgi:hypothetical protein
LKSFRAEEFKERYWGVLGTSYNAPVKEKVEKIKTMVFSLLKYSP